MSRKILMAALSACLAGGVYLTAAETADASNMGFKLEREFPVHSLLAAPSVPMLNIYHVSFPLFNGLGDVANSGPSNDNKCVGDPAGPASGDGVINADDAICDLWTSRRGAFTFARWNSATCQFEVRTGEVGGFGVTFSGPYVLPLTESIGYRVATAGTVSDFDNAPNRSVIVGSHDPSFAGLPILNRGCVPVREIINVPYHTMYRKADEILCGLEGVDFNPDGAGNPDRCDNGTWDGTNAMTVSFIRMERDGQPTDNLVVGRSVELVFGAPSFTQTNFDLRPGDAYVIDTVVAHAGSVFLSPHF